MWGIIYGTTIGVTKGDTRSLDSSSYEVVNVWCVYAGLVRHLGECMYLCGVQLGRPEINILPHMHHIYTSYQRL